MKRLLVINGHPDPRSERYCGALSTAYQNGAAAAGWETRRLNVGQLPLSTLEAFTHGYCPDTGDSVLGDLEWANRLAVIYPVWFDLPPEGLRAIFSYFESTHQGPLGGRKAHVIATMDMPAFAYRSMLKPGVPNKSLMLEVPGLIAEEPVLIGCVSTISADQRRQWLEKVRELGARTMLGCAVAPVAARSIAARFGFAAAVG